MPLQNKDCFIVKYLFSLSFLIVIISCQNPTEKQPGKWVSDGLKIADVDSMIINHSMRADDTLIIHFIFGSVPGSDVPKFSHFQTLRDSFSVAITIWAEGFHWEGDIAGPPSDDRLYINDIVLTPPFYSPHFIVTIHQNDKSDKIDTVTIN
jgi:hypothetical protein